MLIELKCPKCGNNEAELVPYFDKKMKQQVASHAVCTNCLGNICVPCEPMRTFVPWKKERPHD